MVKLCINLDHVATLREARKEGSPSLLEACVVAEQAGADGITLHLREDRRHVQDKDLEEIRPIVRGNFTLEMAATDEMLGIAKKHKPDLITIVPEKRHELTTEGGLNLKNLKAHLTEYVKELKKIGLRVSLFIEPELTTIEDALEINPDCVELHTGFYANSDDPVLELDRLKLAAIYAYKQGLQVNAGHGLNRYNLRGLVQLQHLSELHIGHALVSRALMVGLAKTVIEFKRIIHNAE